MNRAIASIGGILVIAVVLAWFCLWLPVDQLYEGPHQWDPIVYELQSDGTIGSVYYNNEIVAYGDSSFRMWQGRCVDIIDGDTIRVLNCHNKSIDIRLDSVDAPELNGQPYGEESRKALSEMILGKMVRVMETGSDGYGRVLAFLIACDPPHVNMAMVHRGHAWHYKQHGYDRRLAWAEVVARENRRGLWALPDPVPPWEWQRTASLRPNGGG